MKLSQTYVTLYSAQNWLKKKKKKVNYLVKKSNTPTPSCTLHQAVLVGRRTAWHLVVSTKD